MEYKYETVYIARYNLDRQFKAERVIFDSYYIGELFGETEAKEIALRFYQKANLDVEDCDITQIDINTLDLDNELLALKQEVIDQSKSLGADDDTYDYFPDLVEAFRQICEHFSKKEIYNSLADYLNETLEYNESDELFVDHL